MIRMARGRNHTYAATNSTRSIKGAQTSAFLRMSPPNKKIKLPCVLFFTLSNYFYLLRTHEGMHGGVGRGMRGWWRQHPLGGWWLV